MTKKDAIPAVLFLAVVLGWFFYATKSYPPADPGVTTDTAAVPGAMTDSAAVMAGSDSVPVMGTATDSAVVAAATGGDAGTTPAAATPPVPEPDESGLLPEYRGLSPAEPIALENNGLSSWVIDVETGGISQVTLHEYLEDRANIEPGSSADNLVLGHSSMPMLSLVLGEDVELSHGRVLPNGEDETHISIGHQVIGEPIEIIQTWTLEKHSYELHYDITIRNHSETDLVLDDLRINGGTMRPTDAPAGFMGSAGIDQNVHLRAADKSSAKSLHIAKLTKWKAKGKNPYVDSDIVWASTENKYFAVILDSVEPFRGLDWTVEDYTDTKENLKDNLLSTTLGLPVMDVPAGGEATVRLDVFIGPKRWELVKDMPHKKKEIMNFDLFWVWHFGPMESISKGLFWLIQNLGAKFQNYGWAIVVTTILLSIIFAYPRHKSSLLSRRMAKLQPEMAKLKEKYKDDPQKQQMKMLELYRIHKVNPATGCLPVLFQIPVFFAFFNVLRSAVELRQASWLWVHDLSMPDAPFHIAGFPINVLAIAMGVAMVVNQKLMPTTADPNQQRIMLFMSLFFVFIGYSMPAGLTLYWVTNTLCSLVQYQVSRRLLDKEIAATEAEAEAAAASDSKKKSDKKDKS